MLLVVGFGIRLTTERVRARIDYPGAALLTGAIVALTLLASWGGVTYAWTSPMILGLGVVAAACLAASWFAREVPLRDQAPEPDKATV